MNDTKITRCQSEEQKRILQQIRDEIMSKLEDIRVLQQQYFHEAPLTIFISDSLIYCYGLDLVSGEYILDETQHYNTNTKED